MTMGSVNPGGQGNVKMSGGVENGFSGDRSVAPTPAKWTIRRVMATLFHHLPPCNPGEVRLRAPGRGANLRA